MSKGQAQFATIAIVGVMSFGASWLGNFILNAPEKSANAIASVQSDVKVLQTEQKNQDLEITTLKDNLRVMNENIIKLLVANRIQPSR